MLTIENLEPGNSYACKFRVETMLDEGGNPVPNLLNLPLKGIAPYESLGIILKRDFENKIVRLLDESSKLHYIVSFDDIWDIDDIEWKDPEEDVGC